MPCRADSNGTQIRQAASHSDAASRRPLRPADGGWSSTVHSSELSPSKKIRQYSASSRARAASAASLSSASMPTASFPT